MNAYPVISIYKRIVVVGILLIIGCVFPSFTPARTAGQRVVMSKTNSQINQLWAHHAVAHCIQLPAGPNPVMNELRITKWDGRPVAGHYGA
jgi:hypothetical protein